MAKSAPFSISIVDNVPAWLTAAIANGWKPGRWARLNGPAPSYGIPATTTSTIAAAKTTPSRGGLGGIVQSFVGGALATKLGKHGTYIIGVGGGHKTYAGNDVFGWDLGSRECIELVADYQPEPDEEYPHAHGDVFGEYRDGSPLNGHTMATPEYFPDENAFYIPKATQYTHLQALVSPNPTPHAHKLLLDSMTWVRLASIQDLVGDGRGWRKGQSGCWVPSIGKYLFNGLFTGSTSESFTATYDPVADVWDNRYPLLAFTNVFQQVLHDPVHDRIILQDFDPDKDLDAVRFRDVASLSSSTTTTVTQTGDIPVKRFRSGGWAWSPNLKACIYWHHPLGQDVYSLTPAPVTTWAWSRLTDDAGDVIVPSDGWDHGLYNRWRVATFGSIDIALVVSGHNASTNGHLYGFRLS